MDNERHTIGGDASATARVVFLFGPQTTHITERRLLELQKSIVGNTGLNDLVDAIRELPLLWPTLQQAFAPLSRAPGAEQLYILGRFIDTGIIPNIAALNNISLAPLTVLFHIVEFLRRDGEAGTATFPTDPRVDSGLGNVQGFCIGFLTAAAVACSRSKTEFQHYCLVALRLAVCIGAVVELDEAEFPDPLDRNSSLAVRWKTEWEQDHLKSTLICYSSAYISCVTDENSVTVTIPVRDISSFAVRLSEGGLSCQSLGLYGRFHHPVHLEAMQSLKHICMVDNRFQYGNAKDLVLPLRSGSTSDLITQGHLHEIALESILTEQSQWFRTVKAAVASIESEKLDFRMVGTESFVPRSISTGSSPQPCESQTPNGVASGPSMPDQPSRHPEPSKKNRHTLLDETVRGSAIAVVGMACRFPEADTLEEFWQLIESGLCAIKQVPKDRFEKSDLWRDPRGPFFGGFLRDPAAFDHRFFGVSGREANSMDPQQRLLLQVAYEALESSGYFGVRSNKQLSDVGCYIGVGAVDYGDNVASHNATAFSASGTLRAFISGKVSHYFGWNGPSITYDTACSSSAVAIHSACKALQTKECSMAIAGGVNVMTSPALFQNLAAASFLSPTGASRAFDIDANGYCRGEGAGLVVLKPLERAIVDGDFVLGVIAGSAVNQGSNCTPITVPVSQSQSSLYQQALFASGVDPMEVSYVEAHGTGTPVGDPIEWKSILQTFGGAHRIQELFLGSIKDNIGHAEAASGVAALLKTILMMQNRTIPKQANFTSLSTRISSSTHDRMTVPKQSHLWASHRLSAVINNYGAAGSNAAIFLQEHSLGHENRLEKEKFSASPNPPQYPFLVTAKSPQSLLSNCAALQSFLARSLKTLGEDGIANLSFNLAKKQNSALEYSWTSTASDFAALSDQLEEATVAPLKVRKTADPVIPVVLCFAGQTGRTVSLSEEVFHNCRILQTHLVSAVSSFAAIDSLAWNADQGQYNVIVAAKCDSICRTLGLPSLFPRIFRVEPIDDLVSLHCMLFSLQYASAKCWLDCGLKVKTLIGHSFGQLTALCVADCLSLAEGISLISTRARLIQDQWGPESGAMLSVEGDLRDVETLFALAKKQHTSCDAEIACYNGPRNFVLAGSRASIEALEDESKHERLAERLNVSRLRNTHAFHSQLTESILPGLGEIAEKLCFKRPSISIETCSLDQNWSSFSAHEIVQHTRMPVYFSQAVERVAQRLKSTMWLETGPGSSVAAMVRRVLKDGSDAQHTFQSVDLGDPNAQSSLAKASCHLWAAGSKAQFWPFHTPAKNQFSWIPLPPYQFEKTRHWLEYKSPNRLGIGHTMPTTNEPSQLVRLVENGKSNSDEALFVVDCTNYIFELCTRGHAVLHHSLCPASVYYELAVRAAKVLAEDQSLVAVPHIEDLVISSPLGLTPSGTLFLLLSEDKQRDETWTFSLFSRDSQDVKTRETHARGCVALLASANTAVARRFQSLKRLVGITRCEQIMNSPNATILNGKFIYKTFSRVVDYAEYFRGVKKIFAHEGEIVGHVSVPRDQSLSLMRSCCDPIAMDNFLQVAGIHVNCLSDCDDNEVFVCTAIGELSFSEQFSKEQDGKRSWTVYSTFESTSRNRAVSDILVLDPHSGELVLTLMGAQFSSISFQSLERSLSRLNGVQETKEVHPNGDTHEPLNSPDSIEISNCQDPLRASEAVPSSDEGQGDQVQLLSRVREMLSEVIEIPISDVQSNSDLADLGVDSLMITEVINELKMRFNATISVSEFQKLTDPQSLVHRLQPSLTRQMPGADSLASSSAKQKKDIQPTELSEMSNGNGRVASDYETHKRLAYTARNVFLRAKSTFDSVANEIGFIGFCHSAYSDQSELVVAYVVEAFASLGCPLASLGPRHHLPNIHHSSKHTKVMSQFYKILENADLITRRSGVMQRTEKTVPTTTATALQATLLDKYPQYASEHRLLHSTGHRLADCLIGRLDPLNLLFGDAKARKLLEDVYTEAPMFKSGTIFLAQYLIDTFRSFDSEQEIEILELGAGTGGTTSYLIDALSKCEQKFRYTFSDLSSSMVAAARKKFARHRSMHFAILDVEQAPPPQFSSHYDIVISTNCIHATRDLKLSCTNIRKMIRPDGILCLVELTQNLFWFDLVFGLLEGWWLFEDGRKHVLADEILWKQCLRGAGFHWVDWTEGETEESRILRVFAASPSKDLRSVHDGSLADPKIPNESQETVVFGQEDGTTLLADIYYPEKVGDNTVSLPVALMIHGGGHVMLSRKDVRPKQTKVLLDAGFLPVSVDYRLCPEKTLLDGPMHDVCNALKWARNTLPKLSLRRPDIRANGDQVVAVGWSTGGQLAMTLAWTAPTQGIHPPQAILAFYSPTDYQDPFWARPNIPRGSEPAASDADSQDLNLSRGTYDKPITAYNVPATTHTIGGWMAPSDPRSRIALYMNWKGQTLPILLNGLTHSAVQNKAKEKNQTSRSIRAGSAVPEQSSLSQELIASISPLAQIHRGNYHTPTFLVHGTRDDLIPWQQSQRTHAALVEADVEAQLRVVDGAVHLFDVHRGFERDESAARAVSDGYGFLGRYVGLE